MMKNELRNIPCLCFAFPRAWLRKTIFTPYYFSKNMCAETKCAPVIFSVVVSCWAGQAEIIQMRKVYRRGLHTTDVVDITNQCINSLFSRLFNIIIVKQFTDYNDCTFVHRDRNLSLDERRFEWTDICNRKNRVSEERTRRSCESY